MNRLVTIVFLLIFSPALFAQALPGKSVEAQLVDVARSHETKINILQASVDRLGFIVDELRKDSSISEKIEEANSKWKEKMSEAEALKKEVSRLNERIKELEAEKVPVTVDE